MVRDSIFHSTKCGIASCGKLMSNGLLLSQISPRTAIGSYFSSLSKRNSRTKLQVIFFVRLFVFCVCPLNMFHSCLIEVLLLLLNHQPFFLVTCALLFQRAVPESLMISSDSVEIL